MVEIQDRKIKAPARRRSKRKPSPQSQLALADNWRGSEEATRVLTADRALGIDPATNSAAAACTIEADPKLIAYAAYKNIEHKHISPVERSNMLYELLTPGAKVVGAVEDMPAKFFKSRAAAKIFTESRTRWSDAVRCLPNIICPPIDFHVQTWRSLIDVAYLIRHYRLSAREVPDPKKSARLLSKATKAAMREWLQKTYDLDIKNDNVVDAIGIARALAIGLFTHRLVLKGKGSASREAVLIEEPRSREGGDRLSAPGQRRLL